MADHNLDINIIGESKPFKASMPASDVKRRAKPNQDIRWKVNETRGFPENAVVFLRFVDALKKNDDGCLVGRDVNHGRHPGRKSDKAHHFVDGHVAFGTSGPGGAAVTYRYQIWYDDPDDMSQREHMLMDPEIIVEGDPDNVPPDEKGPRGHKAARRSTSAKRAPKKKASLKKKMAKQSFKKARKAKKAKKARRSIKRSAKKR